MDLICRDYYVAFIWWFFCFTHSQASIWGKLSPLHLLTYSITDAYFILWVINQCYLFGCSVSSSFGHWELFRVVSFWHASIFPCSNSPIISFLPSSLHPSFFPLSYFLALQDIAGLFCIFRALFLESVVSPRSPVPFIAKCYLETKDGVVAEHIHFKKEYMWKKVEDLEMSSLKAVYIHKSSGNSCVLNIRFL